MIVLLFSLFAALSGLIEAILYGRRGAEAFTHNEHVEMTLQRASVVLLVLAAVLLPAWLGRLYVAFELVPALLVFPLVHDEAYNFSRLWLKWSDYYAAQATLPGTLNPDVAGWRVARYEYRYGYQSPTTTARNDFSGSERTALAVLGAALWLVGGLYLLLP